MIAFQLAFRNLMGAGLRTWLNVFVLSVAFVVIVLYNGMLDGWNHQAHTDTINWETGHGQLWHPKYDPYDPYCYEDAHALISDSIRQLIIQRQLTPVLITLASAYPQGRLQNILLKGIDPNQTIIRLPAQSLTNTHTDLIPVIIGKRMAETSRLGLIDTVLIRWRDTNGVFDACQVVIADIFSCNVPSIDNGQMWMAIDQLQRLTGLQHQATLLIAGEQFKVQTMQPWQFKNNKFLMQDIDTVIAAKKWSSSIIYLLLLAIALLAIFDTQVLSIFRRQKEIGTYMALGMTRGQVIGIFTIEGSTHSILAICVGAFWGVPLLWWLHEHGIPMPQSTDEMGLSIADKIVPMYSLALILTSIALVVLSATVVSYFPTRKILHLHPTDALKGKIQ